MQCVSSFASDMFRLRLALWNSLYCCLAKKLRRDSNSQWMWLNKKMISHARSLPNVQNICGSGTHIWRQRRKEGCYTTTTEASTHTPTHTTRPVPRCSPGGWTPLPIDPSNDNRKKACTVRLRKRKKKQCVDKAVTVTLVRTQEVRRGAGQATYTIWIRDISLFVYSARLRRTLGNLRWVMLQCQVIYLCRIYRNNRVEPKCLKKGVLTWTMSFCQNI